MALCSHCIAGVALSLALLAAPSDAAAQPITMFPLPTAASGPSEIVMGADGNLWFTERLGNRIGRITPQGVITEFPVPTPVSEPFGIAAGPDGNVWFTETTGSQIGRITPAGVITEFPLPAGSVPYDIIAGPGGDLWFTAGGSLGRITTSGTIVEVPNSGIGSLRDITADSDGNIWSVGSSSVWRLTPDGSLSSFSVGTTVCLPHVGCVPVTIPPGTVAAGDPGDIWHSLLGFAFIPPSRVMRTAGGLAVGGGSLGSGNAPVKLAAGSDGNMWFTAGPSGSGPQIARITPAGTASGLGLPADSRPFDLTADADGNMWFTDTGRNAIGRLELPFAAVAVFRPQTAEWFVRRAGNGSLIRSQWGAGQALGLGDAPVPADYDGDGRSDFAV
jgi:virginiamycin B lyase